MNGVWTMQRTEAFEKVLKITGSEEAAKNLILPVAIGDFCRPMATEFFDRMSELGVPVMAAASIPREMRDIFYNGEAVILKWDSSKNGLIILTKGGIEREIERAKKVKIIPYTDTPPPYEQK